MPNVIQASFDIKVVESGAITSYSYYYIHGIFYVNPDLTLNETYSAGSFINPSKQSFNVPLHTINSSYYSAVSAVVLSNDVLNTSNESDAALLGRSSIGYETYIYNIPNYISSVSLSSAPLLNRPNYNKEALKVLNNKPIVYQ